MFNIAEPFDSEIIDGCRVVRLQDSASDLKVVLETLCEGLAMHATDKLTFDVKLAILRLSTKYQMDRLQRGIIRLLHEDWSLNYCDYVARQKFMNYPDCRVLDATRLIEASHDVPELLPTAFYELASSPVHTWGDAEHSVVSNLSPNNIWRLFVGRERRAARYRALWQPHEMHSWKLQGSPFTLTTRRQWSPCCSAGMPFGTWCPALERYVVDRLGRQVLDGTSPDMVLRHVKGPAEIVAAGVCQPCAEWFFPILQDKAQEMWKSIPEDFDLPKIDPRLYDRRMFRPS